jgi:hypothetical protein
MRRDEHKFVQIPENEIQQMIGKSVHVRWAKFGCVWKLVKVENGIATLRTPKTQKIITTKQSDLCFVRADAERRTT